MTDLSDYIDLTDWLKALGRLGVDGRTTFPEETALTKRVDKINAALNEYRETSTTSYNTHAKKIASGDSDAAGIIDLVNQAAHETKPDHSERVLEIFERTLEFAQRNAYLTFKRRGATILDSIHPQFDALAARILDATVTVPRGVLNLDDAARLGHADAYLQLERDIQQWDQVLGLIQDWIGAGILAKDHPHRSAIEYMVGDAGSESEARAGSSNPLRRARGIAAGHPRLGLPSGTPLEPVLNDSRRWATLDANDADRAARAALGLSE